MSFVANRSRDSPLNERKKLRKVLTSIAAFMVLSAGIAEDTSKAKGTEGKVPVPPLMNGGIAGLWYREHAFIEKEYGEFELLNYDNVDVEQPRDSLTARSWKLTAMGDFLPGKKIQYAALARIKGRADGTLLVMFEWTDPTDTTRSHGVFYHSFIGKNPLLVRKRQGLADAVDTLEFSCSDLERVCGRAYYREKNNSFSFDVVDKD